MTSHTRRRQASLAKFGRANPHGLPAGGAARTQGSPRTELCQWHLTHCIPRGRRSDPFVSAVELGI
jgi:hypothetical protein